MLSLPPLRPTRPSNRLAGGQRLPAPAAFHNPDEFAPRPAAGERPGTTARDTNHFLLPLSPRPAYPAIRPPASSGRHTPAASTACSRCPDLYGPAQTGPGCVVALFLGPTGPGLPPPDRRLPGRS